MAAEPKRRKIDHPPSRWIATPYASKEKRTAKSLPVAQTDEINFRIQQAKSFAIAQAQQEGCTGSFRVFDSPFRNFFVPVVPTRAELAD
ncbi:hypothetical protein FNV43_RR16883 [Rhamnella rubrinervis]|uniref:Uncharacterized protein n=1 Tax=Rhamnella rubrinervis TaxID=2594499 RepID=A0A8K0GZP1_9ROSA|nr:hypothetical protein FNV43_RR16883 [Rhamnella rubrinervis]